MEHCYLFICWRYFFNLVFIVAGLETFAQDIYQETGLPYFQNYDDDVYKARYDNWGCFQASNGLMYFGNGFGILEFDGVSWRLIQMPNQGVVRSFAMDSGGRIFVGGHADFGYLEPDAIGQLQFVSLNQQLLRIEDEILHDYWRIHCLNDTIYYMTSHYLVRYVHDSIKLYQASTGGFIRSHLVNDRLLVEDRLEGMLLLGGDSLIPARQFIIPSGNYTTSSPTGRD